jgi:hypothetical protein
MRRLADAVPKDQQLALEVSEIEPMKELIIRLQERLEFWRGQRQGLRQARVHDT